MIVKSRDTSDAGPFRSRTLTEGAFFLIGNFRDGSRTNRLSLTGKNADMRMLSLVACTALHKVQTCGHATETIVEVSSDHGEGEKSPALAGSRFGEFGAMQINQLERCITPRNLGVPMFDVADRGRREPDKRANLGERHPD